MNNLVLINNYIHKNNIVKLMNNFKNLYQLIKNNYNKQNY